MKGRGRSSSQQVTRNPEKRVGRYDRCRSRMERRYQSRAFVSVTRSLNREAESGHLLDAHECASGSKQGGRWRQEA